MKSCIPVLIMAALIAFAGVASAGEEASGARTEAASQEAKIRRMLLEANPDLPLGRISESPLPGFYEVSVGGTTLYVHRSGGHFFAGDLFFVAATGFVNATEENRMSRRRDMLAALDESEMLVFSPPPDKVGTSITVFTDIDCGYCRQLHREVPTLNRYGIAVRYLAFPRAGIGSASYDKIVSAWCADNPQDALTRAKAGREIEQRNCANPVARQYAMAGELGVTGTPAIVYESGYLQSGYLPAEEMARRLGVFD